MVGLQVYSKRKQVECSDVFDMGYESKRVKNDFSFGLDNWKDGVVIY